MPPAAAAACAVVPPVRAEGIPHRARRVERQRRDIHAPAGSAGGAPRSGARAGAAPGLAGVLAWGAGGSAAAGCGAAAAGSSPAGRGPRGRSSRARAAPAAMRSSSSRLSPEDRAGAGVRLVDQPLDLVVHHLGGALARSPAAGRTRGRGRSPAPCRPRRAGRCSSLMPNWVTMRRASAGGALDVVPRAGRDLVGAEDDLLGHPAAEEHRQAADEPVLAVVVPVHLGQRRREAERPAARHDGDLMDRIAARNLDAPRWRGPPRGRR